MLLLNPRSVRFGALVWEGVTILAIDRAGARVTVAWGDKGPHAVFADVPEQRVSVRVVMEVDRDDVGVPRPREVGVLSFYTSPNDSDGGRRRVSMTAVVTGVSHELSQKKGALRTVEMVAVSADGAADPVSVVEAGGEV